MNENEDRIILSNVNSNDNDNVNTFICLFYFNIIDSLCVLPIIYMYERI